MTSERNAGHQHEIELRGGNQGAQIHARLRDAPHAGDELPRRVANLVELEHPAIALDPGQHQRFAPRERIVYEAPGFEFAPEARVSHHAAGVAVGVKREQPFRNALAQGSALGDAQLIAPREDLPAYFALRANSDGVTK